MGTWATAPQLTEPANNPPVSLSDSTLRQIFYTSIGGERLRMHISNEYGSAPVEIVAAHIANFAGGHNIAQDTDQQLSFDGATEVTIPAGATVTTDVFDFGLSPVSQVAVTLAFGNTPEDITGHPGSRTTSFIASGNVASEVGFQNPTNTDHWYYVTGIDVEAPATASAVVTFGDSITDGRGSVHNENNRWPDALSRRLRQNMDTEQVAVLNQGIGGNAVVTGGLGPTGLERFERDVLSQSGVRSVIFLIGVNDIGESTSSVAQDLISAYETMVSAAREAGIAAYGVPILPFGGSFYDSPEHESDRQQVNEWIRAPGNFDAVIDLEAAVRDPNQPTRLLSDYDDGDQLHLNPTGYEAMADAIDLGLFSGN